MDENVQKIKPTYLFPQVTNIHFPKLSEIPRILILVFENMPQMLTSEVFTDGKLTNKQDVNMEISI